MTAEHSARRERALDQELARVVGHEVGRAGEDLREHLFPHEAERGEHDVVAALEVVIDRRRADLQRRRELADADVPAGVELSERLHGDLLRLEIGVTVVASRATKSRFSVWRLAITVRYRFRGCRCGRGPPRQFIARIEEWPRKGRRYTRRPASTRAISSAVERCLHTAEVTGSKPVSPTMADYVIPEPEPKQKDERLAMELRTSRRTRCSRERLSARSSARTASTTWRTRPTSRTAGTPSSDPGGCRVVVPVVGEIPDDERRALRLTGRPGGAAGPSTSAPEGGSRRAGGFQRSGLERVAGRTARSSRRGDEQREGPVGSSSAGPRTLPAPRPRRITTRSIRRTCVHREPGQRRPPDRLHRARDPPRGRGHRAQLARPRAVRQRGHVGGSADHSVRGVRA